MTEPWLKTRGLVYYLVCTVRGKRIHDSLHVRDDGTAQARNEALKLGRIKLKAYERGWVEQVRAMNVKRACATVGQVLDAYEAITRQRGAPRPATVTANVAALERVVRISTASDSPRSVPLDMLTARSLVRYGDAVMGDDPTESARRSAVSTVRQARSVFSADLLTEYRSRGLAIPDMQDWMSKRVATAKPVQWEPWTPQECEQAAAAQREVEKIGGGLEAAWILAYHCALRASEIAACRWTWFAEKNGAYTLEVKDRPAEGWKCKGRPGAVPVAADVYAKLQRLRVDSPYVIGQEHATAREDLVKRTLAKVMRDAGWTRRHTAHELRAWRIDRWREQYGLVVAAEWGRHLSLLTTARHYSGTSVSAAPLGIDGKPSGASSVGGANC